MSSTGSRDEVLSEGPRIYRHSGRLRCNLVITDEVVLISGTPPDAEAVGSMIESRNRTVRRWAMDVFERYRARSESITAEELTA